MFRFFRKVRKALLGDNKILKYSYYLVGEIALVVAGILIAFQIDNWNEDKIIKNRMSHIYQAINKELKSDLKLAVMIDSVYTRRIENCSLVLDSGITRQEFIENPYFYFNLPLRSHTSIISPKGYENLMRNIDHVPIELDTLVLLLNGMHTHLKEMNTKYDFRLDDFTWKLMARWSKERNWFYELYNEGRPSEEAIIYFTENTEYKNILSEYTDYLFNASISIKGVIRDAPKCIELIESID